MTKPVLHYLECRGRGQALRAQLADANVDFEDRRYPIEDLAVNWPPHAAKPEETGPFSAVPMLQWGSFRLAQTLPIAYFLDAKLGACEGLGAEQLAHQQMIASAAALDITLLMGQLAWQPVMHAGTSLEASARAQSARVSTKLRQLDALYAAPGMRGGEGPFWNGAQPSSADFAVVEALQMAEVVLQQGVAQAVEQCPALSRLREALCARLGHAECEARAPKQLAASPVEMDVRRQIGEWGTALTAS